MTRVGLVGSGHIGSTVAKLPVDAGHQVVLGNSRGPETLAGLVAELGPQAHAATSTFQHLMNLARPAGSPDRSCLPVAGDDEQAKAAVSEFLDSIGYDVIDAGSLADSWRQQPSTPVYTKPCRYGPVNDEKGTPAGTDVIRRALAAATH